MRFVLNRKKTKHTSFLGYFIFCVPLWGHCYFLLTIPCMPAPQTVKKLKMILEITTTFFFFPLLISVIVGLNVALEEKASHFQTLLAVPNRHKNMLAKLTYLYGSGVFALFFLFLLFVIGIHLLGMADTVQLGMLIGAAAGMAFCNFIIYILHLFLSFKFGLGLSLFWGVFESLQCILYSNIELKGVARYIPLCMVYELGTGYFEPTNFQLWNGKNMDCSINDRWLVADLIVVFSLGRTEKL